MDKKILTRIFFVEGNEIEDNGTYSNIFSHDQISKQLLKYGLREIKEYEDWYTYHNDKIELIVSLNQEDLYFESDNTTITIEQFKKNVSRLAVLAYAPLTNNELNLIQDIMKMTNYNLYSMDEKKHYNNIEELKQGLERLGLLAK